MDKRRERTEEDVSTQPVTGAAGRTDHTGEEMPVAGFTRRRALQVLAAGAVGAAMLPTAGCADDDGTAGPETAGPGVTVGGNPRAARTLADPDLLAPVVPWDLVLTGDELDTLAVLCDVMIPADDRSPSASAVGAHDFIDEWVSAPYDGNRDDLVLVRGGLVWLGVESAARFGRPFAGLTAGEQTQICDDICYGPERRPGVQGGSSLLRQGPRSDLDGILDDRRRHGRSGFRREPADADVRGATTGSAPAPGTHVAIQRRETTDAPATLFPKKLRSPRRPPPGSA